MKMGFSECKTHGKINNKHVLCNSMSTLYISESLKSLKFRKPQLVGELICMHSMSCFIVLLKQEVQSGPLQVQMYSQSKPLLRPTVNVSLFLMAYIETILHFDQNYITTTLLKNEDHEIQQRVMQHVNQSFLQVNTTVVLLCLEHFNDHLTSLSRPLHLMLSMEYFVRAWESELSNIVTIRCVGI